ncbi:hypothetical protein [Kribbella sp. NBC_00662]|uniref:hypothetical protein n=1 Tax=Kribbella sp. NBC_00662 TaxID=2975969 RepID=UPI00352B3DBC
MVCKPDRIARSMKELLVLLEDQLHARTINLHILTGICAGTHRRQDALPGPPSTAPYPPDTASLDSWRQASTRV